MGRGTAICAVVKGLFFKQFSLEQGIKIREVWSRIRYH